MARKALLNVCPPDLATTPQLGNDWDVYVCRTIGEARELGKDSALTVGVVTLDNSPRESLASLETLLLETPHIRWVALVHPQALEQPEAKRLIHHAFFDFHTTPLDYERLRITLGHAHGMASLQQSSISNSGEHGMVGESPQMRQLYRAIRKAAAVNAPILIQGESGTGKELVALAIHQASSRCEGPFIAVNCGALPATLIHSELFGHERGAFTGANQRRIGKIEAAASGTIFLDEIGDLPLDLQVNLLRFLEDRKVDRLGGTEPVKVDVRIIAASHVDLPQAVSQGRFREDLLYRLNVLRAHVPPLREREGDITLLANHFFHEFRAERHPRIRGFSTAALEAMEAYPWPGNVRELMNRVRHAMVMGEHSSITPVDLGLDNMDHSVADQTLDSARDAAEKTLVAAALRRARHNISEAARQLGISRVTLYRLMEKYGLRS